MAGFLTFADLITAIKNGQQQTLYFAKSGLSSPAANLWFSLWYASGTPLAGSDPASSGSGGTSYNSDTVGALFAPNVSTAQKSMVSLGASSAVATNFMIYDRLTAVSGISVTSIANVTVGTPTLPRYSGTDAQYAQPWLEVTTSFSGANPTFNITYTNENNNGSRAGPALSVTTTAGTQRGMIPLPIQAGDRGIRTFDTLNVTANATTAGVANALLIRPLAYIFLPLNIWTEIDFVPFYCDLLRLYDGAQLGIAFLSTASTTPAVAGSIKFAWA